MDIIVNLTRADYFTGIHSRCIDQAVLRDLLRLSIREREAGQCSRAVRLSEPHEGTLHSRRGTPRDIPPRGAAAVRVILCVPRRRDARQVVSRVSGGGGGGGGGDVSTFTGIILLA